MAKFWDPAQGRGDPTLPTVLSHTATTVLLIGVGLAFFRRDGRRLPWANALLLITPVLAIAGIIAQGAYAEYVRSGPTPGLQGRYLLPGTVGVSVAFAGGAASLLRRHTRLLPAFVLGGAAVIQATIVDRVLRASWGPADPFSLRESIDALLAWSPCPSPAVIGLWLLLGAA
jgi:hypothetical protein